jgi:transcriptional regulator with PAS, ATPase and Fis domain
LKVVIEKALDITRLRRQLDHLREEQQKWLGSGEIIGASPAMKKVFGFIKRIVHSDTTTVLITGESGTGKELVARAIHSLSSRREKPFMTVNCSAIPETLFESEIFGHEKGAFTGAESQRKGIFELADGGAIFLDEIGEVSPAIQVKLLRVLEEKSFKRVGGTADIGFDVRFIAATNQSLEQRMQEGRFREDLYYRLCVASVDLPPLRERGDDVLLLAQHFIHQYNMRYHREFKGLAEDTRDLFRKYSWPGNIRELKNVLERSILLADGEYVPPDSATLACQNNTEVTVVDQISGNRLDTRKRARATHMLSLDDLEKEAILSALRVAKNNQSKAARLLKVSRDTLRYRIKKYKLARQ